jgi:cytochrome c-type biogenesis protein CcmH
VILWLALGGLTLAVVAGIVRPLLRRAAAPRPSRGTFDRLIYRDQLAELARDVERGVIDAGQVTAARLEIERRLLATESGDAAEPGAAPVAPVDGLTIVMLAASVSAGAVALYVALGSPNLVDAPHAARWCELAATAEPSTTDIRVASQMNPEERRKALRRIIDTLAAGVESNPDDAASWLRLANTYRSLGETEKADSAASRAAALRPNEVAMLLEQAHVMLAATGAGRERAPPLSAPLVGVMTKIAALDPEQPEALWYLGLAAAQHHDRMEATRYWRRLLAVLKPGSEDYSTVQSAVDALALPK